MIFYFSGTGNSQFVAMQLAEMIADDEVVSINPYLKEGKKGTFQSNRPLVFVAPTYCWRMPKEVERWIMESDFQGHRDAYFILTCGGSCGNAGTYAEKLCSKKGLRFCGLAPIVMPENYLALFPTPSETECGAIIEAAKPAIVALAERINSSECFVKSSPSLLDRFESGPVNPLFYALYVRDKGFVVSDQCTACGKCAWRCTLNNIELVAKKPIWKGKCTHCMACISGCPNKAIKYKSKSKDRHHHYIMNDALCQGKERQGD